MKVRAETKARILAVTPAWTGIGIQRRLQALSRLGWSGKAMEAHCGVRATNLRKLRRNPGGPTFVRLTVADAIMAMFHDLQMRPAPTGASATETRNHALARGWWPPLAWDDIDDPAERPVSRLSDDHKRTDEVDEAVVLRVLAGDVLPTTRAEKEVIVARWVAAGGSERSLCLRLGWKDSRYKSLALLRADDTEAVA